ncbi:MAG: hypothetical protein M3Y03_07315 [Verrucomicrobiota bacterium]|nr:hypothetical protein [Verrucomicrobiota bacterium]
MSIRFEPPFRVAIARVRPKLEARECLLFDLLCAAGQLGYRLPDDDINLRAGSGSRDPRKRLAREFPQLRATHVGRAEAWQQAGDRLTRLLLAELSARDLPEEARALRVLLAYATIALAPDCAIPLDPFSRAAWETAVKLFARLFPSKVKSLGSLDCVQRRLPILQREVAAGLRIGRFASGRRPGKEGARLAVDPELIDRVSRALEKQFAPGYMARYLFYTKPGDHIWPHPDDPKFAVTVLVCVHHQIPPGNSARSAFLAYSPNESVRRYELSPGSALAVEPGMIHARGPVQKGERVALFSIGLCLAA